MPCCGGPSASTSGCAAPASSTCPENEQTGRRARRCAARGVHLGGRPRAPAPRVVHALAREGRVRPGVPEADRDPAHGLSGEDAGEPVVHGQDLRDVRQGPGRGRLDRAQARPARARRRAPSSGATCKPETHAPGDGHPRRHLLGLPRGRDVPARSGRTWCSTTRSARADPNGSAAPLTLLSRLSTKPDSPLLRLRMQVGSNAPGLTQPSAAGLRSGADRADPGGSCIFSAPHRGQVEPFTPRVSPRRRVS